MSLRVPCIACVTFALVRVCLLQTKQLAISLLTFKSMGQSLSSPGNLGLFADQNDAAAEAATRPSASSTPIARRLTRNAGKVCGDVSQSRILSVELSMLSESLRPVGIARVLLDSVRGEGRDQPVLPRKSCGAPRAR